MIFLRLGEIPKNEKSINFLKMTNEQNENYTYTLEACGYDEALSFVPENAFENGISCFFIENDMPVLDSVELLRSFCARIKEAGYIIEAEQTGKGQDLDPLVKNVRTAKRWQATEQEKIEIVHNILGKMFKIKKAMPDCCRNSDLCDFTDWKTNKKSYVFNGVEYSD